MMGLHGAGKRVTELHMQQQARAWFVSDLHLWQDRALTNSRFVELLQQATSQADALFVLGDLFEYWAGDDDLENFALTDVVAALKSATASGLQIYIMHGNRDFLLGNAFAQATGCTLLADECLLEIGLQRVLLMHGDSLCTDDVEYQRFRAQVRNPAYQENFLSQPLEARHALIARMRAASEDKKARAAMSIMDVNSQAVEDAMNRHAVGMLIHGHTHRPDHHVLNNGRLRWVLPDWDHDTTDATPRGWALALTGRKLVNVAS
jgi:UDP-2,3-diacylglucosamine hydrolase